MFRGILKRPDEKLLLLTASGALGLAVTAMLMLARAPYTADLILPRRLGFTLFDLFIAAQRSPSLRSAVSWGSVLMVLLVLIIYVILVRVVLKQAPWRKKVLVGVGAAVLMTAMRYSSVIFLDLLQNVWGAPGSVDLMEPLMAFVWIFMMGQALGMGILATARGVKKRAAACAAVLILPTALLAGYGSARLDRNAASLSEAAGIPNEPRERRTLVILKETDSPDYEVSRIGLGIAGQVDYSQQSLEKIEEYLGRGKTFFTREALRHLYGARTVRMEADALRASLLRAHRSGDQLARLLLISHLRFAPVEERNIGMLDEVSDESRYRIGVRGAALLAKAYEHMGVSETAQYWRSQASIGPAGIPSGLLGGTAPASSPAALSGRVRSAEPLLVGLYARESPLSPYGLAPSELVASMRTGKDGSFRFENIAPGDYYLALALDFVSADVSVTGHKGDIRVAGKDLTIAPLVVTRL